MKLNSREIVLKKLPYEEYLWVPTPHKDLWNERYKLFYGVPKDTDITFVSKDEWKKNFYKN
ncbi:hypothetical protein IR152_15420 [Clostridioides sp. ES-S-0108-01]|uniref:hypothetical protein n=1 Tax=Clostridioides sp. ES-S-0108-01 TaxID=2770773 RepID=UPI001D0C4075|nr:hypothetical protein [Clostridioides sp. ES-S-0108-01]UDN50432.1 hypothetical protein JJC16_13850 [Clostridioides sp. ES-S-0107-01]